MNNNFINELYIGNSSILPIQAQLSLIRSKFKNKLFSNSMNTDKDILKFNRMIEKFFGYKSFSLNISSNNTVNAYTYPIYTFSNNEQIKRMINSLQASKNGFRHDPKNGEISAICTINMGLINYENIIDEEIMAILLHEIGHTFFEAVTDKECIYTLTYLCISSFRKINNIIFNRISSAKNITTQDIKNDIDSIGNNIYGIFNKIKNKVFSIPHSIIKSFKNIISNISSRYFKESMYDNMRKDRIEYTNEKFADSFAVMYGYGKYLASSFIKMDDYCIKELNINESKNSIVIIFKVYKKLLFDAISYARDMIDDEHPNDLARIKTSIEYLKRELAKEGLDPKIKRELISQIEEMNKLIDDYINFPKDEDSIAVRRAYYKELYKRFGGDRREQDTDNQALFDEIDKRYNELMKGKG